MYSRCHYLASRVRTEDRIQEFLERLERDHEFRPLQPSANDRKDAKYYEHVRHRGRRFVQVMFLFMRTAELAEESHVHLARHVEDGEPSAQQQECPHDEMPV